MSDITLADRVEGTYRPGGSTMLGSSDDPGKVGTEDLEGDGGQGGKRIVWHYDQQDGTREFTLRYRIRGAAKAYGDALVVPWACGAISGTSGSSTSRPASASRSRPRGMAVRWRRGCDPMTAP